MRNSSRTETGSNSTGFCFDAFFRAANVSPGAHVLGASYRANPRTKVVHP